MDYKPQLNVTDKIHNKHTQWKRGDIVLISSGTASGKSYFVRNKLEELADQDNTYILLLVNRSKLFRQNVSLIGQSFLSRIKVDLYQNVERELRNGTGYDFSRFKYIVCDESHYFTSDSTFNDYSDESLKAILNLKNHVRIFMSATGSILFSHINESYSSVIKKSVNKIWTYTIPKNFSNIASLSFYTKFSSVERLIEKRFSDERDKIIYFAKSIQSAHELHMKYRDSSMFVCSDSNAKYAKYIDFERVESMVKTNKFDCKYLFTTIVLDNGFDLKDENIKLIICDIFDIDIMLQCIGRKRFKDLNDKVHIVLYNHTNRDLYNYKLSVDQMIKEAETFMQDGVDGLVKLNGKFGKGSNYIIADNVTDDKYSSAKTVSRTKYLQSKTTSHRIGDMLLDNKENNKMRKALGEREERDAYMMYIMNLFNLNKIAILDSEQKMDGLSNYIDCLVGKKIYKDEQSHVIEKFNLRDYNNRLQKDIKQLQAYLISNMMQYSLACFKDNRRVLEDGNANPNRGKYYWSFSKH